MQRYCKIQMGVTVSSTKHSTSSLLNKREIMANICSNLSQTRDIVQLFGNTLDNFLFQSIF